jgi:phosphoglycerol transferase MdoB-like AlkP superfamily enzyme
MSESTAATPLRTALRFVTGYVILSLVTVVALGALTFLLPQDVTIQAWVRGVIVAGTSLLTLRFARRARSGGGRALLRLRIIVVVLLVAVVGVLFFLPLPLWMVIEQALCGVLLVATATQIFRRDAQPAAA